MYLPLFIQKHCSFASHGYEHVDCPFFLHIPGEAFTVVDEEGRHIAGGKHYTIYAGFSQPDAKSEELTGMSPVKVEFRKR